MRMPSFTKVLNFCFTAITVGLLAVALFRPGLVEDLVQAIGRWVLHIGNWNYLVVFVSSCIESFPVLGVLVPGQQVMLLVGGFFGRDHLAGTMACASAGAILGNWIGFVAGARWGEVFLRNHGDIFAIGRTERKILERQIAKNGPAFVLLGKFHNFTRAFVPFLAGTGKMHPKRFWPYNIAGSVLWACAMMVFGIFFADHLKAILDSIGFIFLGILLVTAGYVWFFRRAEFSAYLADKRAELDEKYSD